MHRSEDDITALSLETALFLSEVDKTVAALRAKYALSVCGMIATLWAINIAILAGAACLMIWDGL